ncbi:putative ankyrin repeat domain-containing protein 22 [Scophthalmus maximus]|uniref:Putative ankyrin repeat domain-containing protein 22 n=1 Tax=Scophthalmus maximus TaxID=52904 RepID=A0A2U9CQL8_SCOMX|nr:putative ankyrin repeat domain-containing protein 22 [Scophthalmus maximus]KAF0025969.1 hypothetical protein F2P81_022850 [Scophthalmus maximus]
MGLVYSEPTCRSAYSGDVRQLYRLLNEDPNNLNVQEGRTGDTPLIAACRRGKPRVVKYLLDNRANVHLTNKVPSPDDVTCVCPCQIEVNFIDVFQKQRTCLHYVSKRTFSLLDYLMICVLMPVLLLGYFLMVRSMSTTRC